MEVSYHILSLTVRVKGDGEGRRGWFSPPTLIIQSRLLSTTAHFYLYLNV